MLADFLGLLVFLTVLGGALLFVWPLPPGIKIPVGIFALVFGAGAIRVTIEKWMRGRRG